MRLVCLRSARQPGRRGRLNLVRTQPESIPGVPQSLCIPRNRQENALFPLKIPSLPHSTYKCIFLTFPILFFFFFPWLISPISCDSFKQGLMLHSCNISLILKDQGSTLPAQLLQSQLSLSTHSPGAGTASSMQRNF